MFIALSPHDAAISGELIAATANVVVSSWYLFAFSAWWIHGRCTPMSPFSFRKFSVGSLGPSRVLFLPQPDGCHQEARSAGLNVSLVPTGRYQNVGWYPRPA